MTTFQRYLLLLAFLCASRVQCNGKFFWINKNDITMRIDEPFLTADVFECGRKKSCTILTRNLKSTTENVESTNADLSMSKTTGLLFKYSHSAVI